RAKGKLACHKNMPLLNGSTPFSACTPPVNGKEQEQPDHVNEVPIPRRRLETEVMGRREMPLHRPDQADQQKDRSDEHMHAVEPSRHIESGRVNTVGEGELRM